jgi:hypothetical protein
VIDPIASAEVLQMLNMEYARLVDEERRRVAEQRRAVERLVHPDDPPLATLASARGPDDRVREARVTRRIAPGPAR